MGDSCPICSSEKFRILGKSKTNSISAGFIDKDYHVVQCGKCETYYVSPVISFTDEQWSNLYNSEYFSIQSKWLIRQREKELKERFDKVQSYLGKRENLMMLDIGTGEGNALVEGKKREWTVTGIDIVDNRIEIARGGDKLYNSKVS